MDPRPPTLIDPAYPPATSESRLGDLGVPVGRRVLVAQAVRFYPAVLGWSVTADEDPDDVHPMLGISGGHQEARAVPCWKVVDVPAALDRVRTQLLVLHHEHSRPGSGPGPLLDVTEVALIPA